MRAFRRWTLRSLFAFITGLCLVFGVAISLHRASVGRLTAEEIVANELCISIDSIHFENGDASALDNLFWRFGDVDLRPIVGCMVSFKGFNNTLDMRVLLRFSHLRSLRLYNCELNDDDWNTISRQSTLRTIYLDASTDFSESGRRILEGRGYHLSERSGPRFDR